MHLIINSIKYIYSLARRRIFGNEEGDVIANRRTMILILPHLAGMEISRFCQGGNARPIATGFCGLQFSRRDGTSRRNAHGYEKANCAITADRH